MLGDFSGHAGCSEGGYGGFGVDTDGVLVGKTSL